MFKRSAFLVTAAIVALMAAGSAAAMVRLESGPAPTAAAGTRPTAQETTANLARGEALNRMYHLGAYASTGGRQTAQEVKANLARAQALNRKYHLGAYASAGQGSQALGEALNARYGNAWTRMSSTKFTTLVKTFGNDITLLTPRQLRTLVAAGGARVTGPSDNGFDWGDAGIGTLGAVAILLGLGAVIAVYVRSHRPQPKLEGAHSAV
jgi:hypothetical protein